jgi:hypothetical protein
MRVRLIPVAAGTLGALLSACSNTQYSATKDSAAFDGYAPNRSALNHVAHPSRSGVLEGYEAGKADQAKNEYWTLQREQEGGDGQPTIEDLDIPATVTEDGRQLTPRRIQVPLVQ